MQLGRALTAELDPTRRSHSTTRLSEMRCFRPLGRSLTNAQPATKIHA